MKLFRFVQGALLAVAFASFYGNLALVGRYGTDPERSVPTSIRTIEHLYEGKSFYVSASEDLPIVLLRTLTVGSIVAAFVTGVVYYMGKSKDSGR